MEKKTVSNKKLRIGIAGIAHMHSQSYIECLKMIPQAEFAGIADETSENKTGLSTYGVKVYQTYEELCKSQEIDAIIITSETVKHAPIAITALEQGKHVIVEKPIATTLADADAMIHAAEKAGRHLIQIYPCRFHPTSQYIKKEIDSGSFGSLIALSGTNHGQMPPHNGSTKWFSQRELSGGGALMDHITHLADLYFWFLKSELKSVYAVQANLFHEKVDIDDAGMVSLEFKNGVKATIDPSWSRPYNFETWGDVTLTVYGTEKTLMMDMFKQSVRMHSNKLTHPELGYFGSNMDLVMLQNFISSIIEYRRPMLTGIDGRNALEVAILAYKSAETGKRVYK
jgi:predicted dehydrogenase